MELIQDVAEILGLGLACAAAGGLLPPNEAAQIQALRGMIVTLEQADPILRAHPRLREQLVEIAASAQRVAQLEAVLLADPLARMAQLKEVLSAGPVTLAVLPEDLRREWVAQDGKAKISVFPKGDANDPLVRERFVHAVLQVAPNAAGTPIQFIEAAGTIAGAFARAGAYAIGAILLLVGITLQRGRDTLLVLCPLLFAGLFTLATMASLGLALDSSLGNHRQEESNNRVRAVRRRAGARSVEWRCRRGGMRLRVCWLAGDGHWGGGESGCWRGGRRGVCDRTERGAPLARLLV